MDIAQILSSKYPGTFWGLRDNNYEELEWDESNAERKPTMEELEDLWPTVEYENAYKETEEARQIAYVTDSDPIFFEWQRGDATEQQWKDAVQAVKDAHPYPVKPQVIE